MTLNEKTYAIAMTRGDSATLTVRCTADPFAAGDTLTLTVRDDAEGDIYLQKVVTEFDDGDAVFRIDPGDTAGMDFGDYRYDVQLRDSIGNVITILPPRPTSLPKFTLTEEATY